MGHVLVLGAASEIGGEVAARLTNHNTFTLAVRRAEVLDGIAGRLIDAGAVAVHRIHFDADDIAAHRQFAEHAWQHGPIDMVIVAFGILGGQQKCEESGKAAASIIHTDSTAQVPILTKTVARIEPDIAAGKLPVRDKVAGRITVFSSIAGARVRRTNHVYGSAKAGLDGFLQGVQDHLHGSHIQLTIVRPGFVIGRMTEGMKPASMSSRPAEVVEAAVTVFDGRKPHIWVPRKLALLVRATHLTPRRIWRKMSR